VFLAPLTTIGADVLRRGFEHAPPMSLPSPEPEQRLLRVPDVAAALAEQPSRSTVSLAELGRMRYQILDDLGLNDPGTAQARFPMRTWQTSATGSSTWPSAPWIV
jgi:hypothetical protein